MSRNKRDATSFHLLKNITHNPCTTNTAVLHFQRTELLPLRLDTCEHQRSHAVTTSARLDTHEDTHRATCLCSLSSPLQGGDSWNAINPLFLHACPIFSSFKCLPSFSELHPPPFFLMFSSIRKSMYPHISWLFYLRHLSLRVLWLLRVQVKIKSQVEDGSFHSVSETFLSSDCWGALWRCGDIFIFRSNFWNFVSEPSSFIGAVAGLSRIRSY